MKEFVSPTQAHGVRFVPEVLDSVFQAFLALTLLGVLVGLRLLLRSVGLRYCGIFHCFSASVRCQGLQCKQDAAHADSQKFQNLEFVAYSKSSESPCGGVREHNGQE